MAAGDSEFDEKAFQSWYSNIVKKNKGLLAADPDDPKHYYDYRSAFSAGIKAPNLKKGEHWPSKYKDDLHPNRYIEQDGGFYDTKYEKKAGIEDIITQRMQRNERLDLWQR